LTISDKINEYGALFGWTLSRNFFWLLRMG